MRHILNLLGMVLVVTVSLPVVAFAAHSGGECNGCHKSGASPRTMSNVCNIPGCHDSSARGAFTADKASDAMDNHPTPITGANGNQTSHFWGGAKAAQPNAGTITPPTSFYNSRYAISTNRITCSLCHNPHLAAGEGNKLLRVAKDNDLICQQCHTGFYQDNLHALRTHPIGDKLNPAKSYAAIQANIINLNKFKPVVPDANGKLDTNTSLGEIKLVNGYVSCTSCHSVHFADSNSSSPDGMAALIASQLLEGDGHMLKADGPTRTNKSALCQTCHNYKTHGKTGYDPAGGNDSVDETIGCLVCHSGHSYDAAAPNYFVLRKQVQTAEFGNKTTLYTTYPTSWEVYCGSCHGYPASTLPNPGARGVAHVNGEDCTMCHAHNGTAYSFAQGNSGCTGCHGAPPRTNTIGDRGAGGPDTGYALGSNSTSYATAGQNFKDESRTAHKRHAGALQSDKVAVDYAFGAAGATVNACLPCHNDKDDAVSPPSVTHDKANSSGSFQDVYFNSMVTYNGLLTPNAYSGASGTCGNIYCHSNGGRRTGSAKILADFKTSATPSWALSSTNTDVVAPFPGAIIDTATECRQCHGESTATMDPGALATQRNNSQTHDKHLLKFGDSKTTCYLCHSTTVDSTGTIPASARDHRTGGTHVNGTVNVVFAATAVGSHSTFGTDLATGTYNGAVAAGTCTVYCHSNGKGTTVTTPDWDLPATGACGACHSTAAGSLSAPHAKHLAIATVTCIDCHGTGATAGTHTGHVNGEFTFSQTACNSCHGWLSGEKTPVWGEPMDNDYCLTCHTGTTTGVVKTMTAPSKEHAKTRGHNATANYTSGNLPGNKQCTSCHLTSITNHVNVTDGDATHLVAAAASCTVTCHGVGGSTVGVNTKGIVSHVGKACNTCHDPHGAPSPTNQLFMIHNSQTTQNLKDTTTGEYSGSVVFTTTIGTDSYDEVDANADDLCATCHTYGSGALSDHNTKTNQGIAHHEGEDCFTAGCHKSHQEAGGAFISGGGSACNGCHGNPPATGAHRPTRGDRTLENDVTNPPRHSRTAIHDESEDRTDCARCHTGANAYTFDPSLDRASAIDGRRNHGNTVAPYNRASVLALAVNYATSGNLTYCSTACHLSSATDGYWFDKSAGTGPSTWNKDAALSCTACHYYVAGATSSANNSALDVPPYYRNLKGSHNAHFAKTKPCLACHGTAPTDTTHISIPLTGTDLEKIQNRAAAVQNEADVLGTIATPSDPGNETCSGANVGLGCHNTKTTPAWTTTGITCTNCHTPGGAAAADPTSGLHVGPITVSGKVHNNTLGTGCANCHTNLAAQATHFNTVFEGGNGQKTQMGLPVTPYTQTANDTGTCSGAGVATGCHSDLGNWARKWSTTARDPAGTGPCANCHGIFPNWNSGVVHAENATRGSGHSNTGSLGYGYPCTDCHVIGASTNNYLFTLGSNDWQVVELGTTKHGDNKLQINSTETFFSDAVARVGCANGTCHPINSDHDYPKSAVFTTANTKLVLLAGVKPPVTCYNCHGGTWSGPNQSNYWPDKLNSLVESGGTSEDNEGRHDIHMQRLTRAVYNEDYKTELLTDYTPGNITLTSDQKQQALCDYCHAGASNHGNKANLPAQVTTMYNLWLPATADANASWNTPTAGNCSNINCHNDKATSLTTNFTWYGAGTKNCLLCHNNINDLTGNTTGATHQAHVAAGAAIFGKAINCASCHGGSPSWDAGSVPANYIVPNYNRQHINGALNVGTTAGSGVSFSYSSFSYTDYDTRTPGNCGLNVCHNNGKNVAAAATWQTSTFTGCTACHGTTDTGLAEGHDGHLLASGTFGKTIVCADCHNAVNASDMTGMTNHMNGTVNLTGVTYNGDVAVTGTTWGQCTNSSCHRTSIASPKDSPAWNTTASGCSTCHGSTDVTLTSGRHEDHLPNAFIASKCGECHAANANNTSMAGQSAHIDGTVNMGGSKTVTFTTPGCTNNCHLVVSATRGDWLDQPNALGCRDCHSGTYMAGDNTGTGGSNYLPRFNMHAVTPTVSGKKHDDTLTACTTCHTGISALGTHINTVWTPDDADNSNDQPRGLFSAFADNTVPTCSGSGVNLAATCHKDDGRWSRKWSASAGLSNGTQCNNCHGTFTTYSGSTGWNTGVIHLPNPLRGNSANHNLTGTLGFPCTACHSLGANSGNYYFTSGSNDWRPTDVSATTQHGDGNITMNSYSGTNWARNGSGLSGCSNVCHSSGYTGGHEFGESTWTSAMVVGDAPASAAGCTTCHGNATNTNIWPDGSTSDLANDQPGEHAVHVLEIAKKKYTKPNPTISEQNTTCEYCHPGNTHGGVDGVVPADVSRTDSANDGTPDLELGTYMKKIVGGGADNNPSKSGYWRRTPGTCSDVACHASAPFTPHWYADTTPPGNVTFDPPVAGPVPRSIKLAWYPPGDDGFIDGTAYKYDIRMGTSSTIATNFTLPDNYVQGIPTVKRRSFTEKQEVIIHNVNPNTTYHFALRTYDRAGNYGGTANAGGYVSYTTSATPDATAPVMTGSPTWYGLDSAKVLDASGTVKLSWTRAEDHTMPITYDIWWSTGTITYGTVSATTKDTSYRVTGLTNSQTYNFAVRARDAVLPTPNRDANTIVLQAIPQGLSPVPKTSTVYYANGSTAPVVMQTAPHTVNATTTTLPAVFYGPTVFTANTDIIANSFSLNVINGNGGATTLRAELGYITGTSTFNPFVTGGTLFAPDQTIPKRATKLVTFKFNGGTRLITSAMNAKLGVRISVNGTNNLTSIGWGPTSKGGILSFATQPINISPSVPTVSTSISGANISLWMNTGSTDATDGVADTIHYDVYGSANGGADGFPYVIATGLTTHPTSGAPLVWDTQAAGIALAGLVNNVQVKVEAGDVINGKILSHSPSVPTNLSVNNSGDNVAPGAITNFKAETRPKQGSVYLSWTAPGDDGSNNGRAASYDIRWSNAVIDTEPKFTAAAGNQLVSEPYPDFGGNGQGYEVLDLAPGTYYFAIKAVDEGNKTSPLAFTTLTTAAGPKCGICHSTPPDEDVSKGNHIKHGYTMNDCSNCHGNDAVLGAQNFQTNHQDGVIKLGWKTANPAEAIPYLSGYKYQQNGFDIYLDGDGSGGFNPAGDNNDDGTCSSWSNQQVSGCHGPALTADWTAGATLACSSCHGVPSRPLDNYGHSFDDPSDDVKAAPPVDNHGYDPAPGYVDPEGERKYVGAHVSHLNASFRMSKGDSCRLCHGASRPGSSIHADGIIDIELDKAAAGATAEWRWGGYPTLPQNPALAGTCMNMSPEACHPTSATPKWDSAETFACTNCHGMNGTTPSHVTDPIGSNIDLPDNDPQTGNEMPGNCTWCHVGGHPKEKKVTAITKANPAVVTTANAHNMVTNDKVTIHTSTGMTEINNKTFLITYLSPTTFSLQGSNSTAYGTFDYGTWIEGNGTGIILLPNDSRVGINYQSGGIHLKATIGARGEKSSEAELCWGCHVPNGISEWGADDNPFGRTANTASKDVAVGNGNYNFGTLTSTPNGPGNWIGAIWQSGTPAFAYKNVGNVAIRSTHSTDATGTVALTGGPYGYTNGGVDVVGKIHCSNCHDVHNSNKSPKAADLLDPSGPPYLRGTWMSNPYKEDGAPQLSTAYTAAASGQPGYGYGAVPRANPSTTQQMGGYWIDQNSGNPTASWSYASSAALCQLCHGEDVNILDTSQGGTENLWIDNAINGHRNSALGGAGSGGANIFLNGVGGRNGTGGAAVDPNPGAWMGFQNSTPFDASKQYAYGPRSAASRGNYLSPQVESVTLNTVSFAWGVVVDATTIEAGYHQFSCSKCHNPHASRLPKLMITNCLDVTRNTWDQSYDTTNENPAWSSYNTAASSRSTMRLPYLSTAQNCHRFIDINNDNTPDEKGWNKVTPW